MMPIKVRAIGLKQLERRLGKLGTAKSLLPSMQEAAFLLQRDLKQYPEQASGSKYKRTNTLKRGWAGKAELRGNRARGIVGTNVPYAPYVQEKAEQSKIHRRRWAHHTTAYIAEKRTGEIIRNVQADIDAIWRSTK